jgi:hypothetical protein
MKGSPITATVVLTPTPTIIPGALVSHIELQGRTIASGVVVTITSDGKTANVNGSGNLISAATNKNSDLVVSLAPGTFSLAVSKNGYLPAQRTGIQLISGQTATLSTITLIAGDINGDGEINLLDLTIVSSNYGMSADFDLRADLNGDGAVNIFDLVLVAANLGKSGAQP